MRLLQLGDKTINIWFCHFDQWGTNTMGFSQADGGGGFDLFSRVCGSKYMLQTNTTGRKYGTIPGFHVPSAILNVYGFTSSP